MSITLFFQARERSLFDTSSVEFVVDSFSALSFVVANADAAPGPDPESTASACADAPPTATATDAAAAEDPSEPGGGASKSRSLRIFRMSWLLSVVVSSVFQDRVRVPSSSSSPRGFSR